MHRLYDYRIKLNKFTTKVTRNRGMTVGSRKKVRAQKGSGKARMGDKRAPHLRKGGKAHGSKAKVYSYTLNGKIKLAALKALLSAKLAEGRIRIVDTEELPEPKTRPLSKILQLHNADDRTLFCVLTHKCPDTNFELAHKNIKQVFWHDSYSLDVLTLFRADKILITVSGLNELVNNINKTAYMLGRQPHMPKLEQKQEEEEEEVDPTKPYEFKFKILAEYLERYEKAKQEKPDLVRAEMLGVRKIDVKI